MNNFKIALVLLSLFCVSSATFAQGSLNSRINLQSTRDISAKANSAGGYGTEASEVLSDPVVNSALNGFANMLQGGNMNFYSAEEQRKQQGDYSRQQIKN